MDWLTRERNLTIPGAGLRHAEICLVLVGRRDRGQVEAKIEFSRDTALVVPRDCRDGRIEGRNSVIVAGVERIDLAGNQQVDAQPVVETAAVTEPAVEAVLFVAG